MTSPAREQATNVRAFQPQDVEPVLTLVAASPEAPQWPRRCYEEMLFPPPQIGFRRIALVISSDPAASGFEVVGFAVAAVLRAERSSELETIVIHPLARHRGLGSQILESLVRLVAEQGANVMHLEVRASNNAAIALYQARSFQQNGRRRGYYQSPSEDALLFERTIETGPATVFARSKPKGGLD